MCVKLHICTLIILFIIMTRFVLAAALALFAQAQDTLTLTTTCEAAACTLANPTTLSAARVDALIGCINAATNCRVTAEIVQQTAGNLVNAAAFFTTYDFAEKTLPTGATMTTQIVGLNAQNNVVEGCSVNPGYASTPTSCNQLLESPSLAELGQLCALAGFTECDGATTARATSTITFDPAAPTTAPGGGSGVSSTMALSTLAGIVALAHLA
eukprot:Protomagalhaensia_wolfi_Nauph_80__2189@NODE_2412_length_1099_cov_326_928302_g1684_i1_p1_GENE_NODE_2412_length_1099_cov_326_928302_g1684_i1NODE_2412_length_1099_cov_326_928302_g1684_i1_p1_ORF_typecomplete_len213_score43_09_NODE_2412_length_1099_cov_326_928302_g1684_i13641002